MNLFAIVLVLAAANEPQTAAGIPLDAGWKREVYAYAQANAQHTAWGIAHSERDYLVAKELAAEEQLEVDDDVLFAAAFLHDIGAIAPHAKTGVDHSVRSVELLADNLPRGFPANKVDAVKAAIMGHMFSADPGKSTEAILLHDADTLDFMGSIGVWRIASITTRHPFAADNATAVKTLREFAKDLPAALKTDAAKRIGGHRLSEMERVLDELEGESYDGKAL